MWATFHTETTLPRSFCDHQWTMVRPLGGQPMPWAQPLMKSRTNMMATLEVAQCANPKMNITGVEIDQKITDLEDTGEDLPAQAPVGAVHLGIGQWRLVWRGTKDSEHRELRLLLCRAFLRGCEHYIFRK